MFLGSAFKHFHTLYFFLFLSVYLNGTDVFFSPDIPLPLGIYVSYCAGWVASFEDFRVANWASIKGVIDVEYNGSEVKRDIICAIYCYLDLYLFGAILE